MNPYIDKIKNSSAALKADILNHKLYESIHEIDDLRIFMKYHIYAVWDFMSLLKSLQNGLTCTTVPWYPKGSADIRYLINEIVVGEESDVDPYGTRISHFELYLKAMEQSGADTNQIQLFLQVLQASGDFEKAYQQANTPDEAKTFLNYTFNTIALNKLHLQAAIFTFGREDLIPGMFRSMVNDLHFKNPESVSCFKYYLDRHIEIDGDHHSHLAIEMVSRLCDTDEALWAEAEHFVLDALKMRLKLWDGALGEIKQRQSVAETSNA